MRFAPFFFEKIGAVANWSEDTNHAIILFKMHVEYVATIQSHWIDENRFQFLMEQIQFVHSLGFQVYGSNAPSSNRDPYSVTSRQFLTINSHTTYHYPELIKRFGSTPCFNTLAFESEIGLIRSDNDKHRSRHSCQNEMITRYWDNSLTKRFFRESNYCFDAETGEL